MKQVEKKIKRRMALLALGIAAVGLLLLLIFFSDYIPLGEEQNLDEITADQIQEGRARITVYYVYDYYCYFTDGTSDKEVQRDYFVSMGPEGAEYVGVELRGKKNDRAYNLMNDIIAAENAGEELDYSKLDYFTVKGKIQRLTGDDLAYYNSYMEECAAAYDMSVDEVKQYFAPYVLVGAKAGSRTEETDYAGIIVAAIFLIAGIALLFYALFGDHLKDVTAYANEVGSKDLAFSRIERFRESTPERYGVRANDEFFIYESAMSFDFARAKDVLWIYPYIVKNKSAFITVSKQYYIKIRLKNGKTVQVPAKKDTTDEMMNYFASVFPDAVFGYSNELENIFNKDRNRMIAEVERRREERLRGSAFEESSYNNEASQDETNGYEVKEEEVSASDIAEEKVNDIAPDNGDTYTGSEFN